MDTEKITRAISLIEEQKMYSENAEVYALYEIAQQALNLQIPKPVIRVNKNAKFDGNWYVKCPTCGIKLAERVTTEDESYMSLEHHCNYCVCGQKIKFNNYHEMEVIE